MEEKTLFQATVCFLLKDGNVLLARKTRKIGAGCFNGYGGGVESDETTEEAAVRELFEETRASDSSDKGIKARPESLQKVAIADFHNTKSDNSTFVCRVHFYFVTSWEGSFEETEEMAEPTWFVFDQLPLEEMMPADAEFVPLILQGKKLYVEAWYGPFQKERLKKTKITEVEDFDML